MPRTTPLLLGISLLVSCGARTGLESELFDAVPPADSRPRDGSPDTRHPDAPVREPEVCNGFDDDLDGEVDEDLPPIRCGQGECQREVPGCLDGAVPACLPGQPLDERCNGLDDDCDGLVDDGLGFGEVAGPHVIRQSHEGTAGDCSSCDWANNVGLADTPDGMLAVWSIGFNGSHPEPNVFVRTLSSDGEPLGDMELLMDENAVDVQLLPSTDDRVLLVYCGRFGSSDSIATRFLDGAGGLIDEGVVRFDSSGCGRGFLGTTEGVGYILSASPLGEPYPLFEGLDADAGSLWIRSLDTSGLGRAELAVSEGSIGLIYSVGYPPQELEFQLRTVDGDILSGPVRFSHGFANHYGPIIAPHSEGWILFAYSGFPGGIARARLSPEGALIAGPDALFPEMRIWRMRIEAFGDGYLFWGYASGRPSILFLWRLDGNGDVTDEWDMPESSFRGAPALVIRESRVFMLYSTGSFGESEVQLREFGCAPL